MIHGELESDQKQTFVAFGSQQMDIAWANEQASGLGTFIRSLVGVDRSAAVEGFANSLDGTLIRSASCS